MASVPTQSFMPLLPTSDAAVATDAATTDAANKEYVDTKIGNTFESVSKNLRQYNYSLNYSSGVLTSIVYTVPSV